MFGWPSTVFPATPMAGLERWRANQSQNKSCAHLICVWNCQEARNWGGYVCGYIYICNISSFLVLSKQQRKKYRTLSSCYHIAHTVCQVLLLQPLLQTWSSGTNTCNLQHEIDILSPIRQNYRKNNYRKKKIIIEIPTHFCDHRGHRFFPVSCLLNVTFFFFYNSVGDCKHVFKSWWSLLLGRGTTQLI